MKVNAKAIKIILYAIICAILNVFVILQMNSLAKFEPKGLGLYSGGFEELMVEVAIMLDFYVIYLLWCYIPAGIIAGMLLEKMKGFILGLLMIHGLSLISFFIIITRIYQKNADVIDWLKLNIFGGTFIYCFLYMISSFIFTKTKMIYARYKNSRHSAN